MNACRIFFWLFFALAALARMYAADVDLARNAARATNELAVDLLPPGQENFCLSPYSIQSALAMTFAGADGDTRTEMARALHFPTEGEWVHVSFAALRSSLGF